MVQKRDLVLLSHLRKNARMGLTAMSKASRVPVSTIYDRLKAYLGTYVVRNTALLDFSQLGFHTRATILFRTDPKARDALRDHLSKSFPVNSLFKINNGYDFCADCVFRDLHELEDFLDRTERQFDIKSKQVFFVIDDIKREAFLSDPSLVDVMVPGPS
jgi:DNA-binding Lrp family transcriptional regulator